MQIKNRGPLKTDFHSDGEEFCRKFCVKNRRNTGCLLRFLKAKVGAKEPPFWRKGVFRGPQYICIDFHIGKSPRKCQWWGKKGGTKAVGRTKGGRNTKIHALTDALGNPMEFMITPGNVNDETPEKFV